MQVALIALAITGCGPVRTATGPCELRVFRDTRQQLDELALPYAVDLGSDPVSITSEGSGWQRVEIVAIRPDGNVDDTYTGAGTVINGTGVAFPVRVPGTWQFRLTDTVAGCAQDFSVEVRRPTSQIQEARGIARRADFVHGIVVSPLGFEPRT